MGIILSTHTIYFLCQSNYIIFKFLFSISISHRIELSILDFTCYVPSSFLFFKLSVRTEKKKKKKKKKKDIKN